MRLPITAINTTLHPISHCFQVIAHYWSNLRLTGLYLSLTQSLGGELLNSGPRNFDSQDTIAWC